MLVVLGHVLQLGRRRRAACWLGENDNAVGVDAREAPAGVAAKVVCRTDWVSAVACRPLCDERMLGQHGAGTSDSGAQRHSGPTRYWAANDEFFAALSPTLS